MMYLVLNRRRHSAAAAHSSCSLALCACADGETATDRLDDFRESLSKFTRFNRLRSLATLHYAADMYNNSSIVSSIEFDRDCDFFAIAGVTKKIKVRTNT